MICPKCFSENVTPISDSHYICNNPECEEKNGTKIQFQHILDEKIRFPYNQIFVNRSKSEFFRKPYLELQTVGLTEV